MNSREEIFNSLDKTGQKRMIVEDAIAQIKAKKLDVLGGDYIKYIGEEVISPEADLKTLLLGKGFHCEVCAKGALFLTCISFVNEVKFGQISSSDFGVSNKLTKWFTRLELDMIEAAFEECVMGNYDGLLETSMYENTELGMLCADFRAENCPRMEDDEALIFILENVLKNGSFDPTKP